MKAKATLATIFVLTILVIMAWQANTAKCQVVTDGLISYWSFDDDTIEGDVVEDIWGENDGTIMGDPQTVKGKIAQALEFDGSGDYILVPADPSLSSFTDQLTLEAWVNTSSSAARQAVINNRTDPPWYLLNIDPGYLMLSIHDGSSALDVKPPEPSVFDGEWHHLVATMDNSSDNGGKIYFDGDLMSDQSVNAPSSAIGPFEVPRELGIGGKPDGSNLFNGIIDDVRIYNRVLSEEEIRHNMDAKGLAVTNSDSALAVTWGKIKK